MSKKPIIVFEGIEGSGKSHHINKVSNFLNKKKIKFLKIREPGGSLNSEKIRRLILNKKSNFNTHTDLLLYLAARSENISLIKKNYKKKIILIDRFIDSTIAYQHYGMGIDYKIIKNINMFLIKGIKIDHTFLNIVSINNLKKRLKSRRNLNKYDRFNDTFYKKVQNGFKKIAKNKSKYLIVNSDRSLKSNKKIILDKVDKLIFD